MTGRGENLEIIDRILRTHADVLGRDFAGYANHAHRVARLCVALSPDTPGAVEKSAIAAAFHDLGIWTDRTFDYLAPSVRLAQAYLRERGRAEWADEVSAMILEHHKLSPYRNDAYTLVEPFRRADWIDVSKGLLRFGVSKALLEELQATWPNAGFHATLVRLELKRLRTHPWSPLPMMRL